MSRSSPGRVRIVAGAKRGQRIKVPAGLDVRPTSEMVREAVFDVLGSVGGVEVVDLFAGTGALGMEAMSRGARGCVFVEADRRVAAALRENVSRLGYEDECSVMVAGYRKGVDSLTERGVRCDLLFVDPPYRMLAEVEAALAPVLSGFMASDGVVVVEGPRSTVVTLGQTPVFEREYGDTKITMVRVKE